jgi:c-di-GMP-binding flagellar brake protein YcgR
MTENKRQHPRQQIAVDVALSFMEDAAITAVTHDVSEGGMLLVVDEPLRFPIGDMVSLNYPDPLNHHQACEKEGIVVRHTDNAVAVAFVELPDF